MKRAIHIGTAGLALGLAACSGGGGAEQNNLAVPPPEETGDLNMAIGGDEISPIPEGEDLVGSNATGNLAAPPPPAAPDNSQFGNSQ